MCIRDSTIADEASSDPSIILRDENFKELQSFLAQDKEYYFEQTISKQGKIFAVRSNLFEDGSYEVILNDITKQEKTKQLKQEIEEFEKQNTALKGIAIRAQIYSGILPPLMNLLNNFGFAVVAGVGGYMAIRQIITIGVIASFITYSRHFARPLNELANQFNIIQSGLSSAERVFDVMNRCV